MYIISSSFKSANVVNLTNVSQQNPFNYRLKTLSKDLVSFNGTIQKQTETKKFIDQDVTDLDLFKQYGSYNLEFVNTNNEMVYNLKFIATLGHLYINEYRYKTNGIQIFHSAIENKYYNIKQEEQQRLFPSSPQNNFKVLKSGMISYIMFDSSSEEKSTFNDSHTLQYSEKILKKILSEINSNDIRIFDGKKESEKKPYDDFNKINSNQIYLTKAFNVLFQKNSRMAPSYKEISDVIAGFKDFRQRALEAKHRIQERERIKNLPDSTKYRLALEKQLANKANKVNIPTQTPKPKAKVYNFTPKKTE